VDDAYDKLRRIRRALNWADADNMGQNTAGPAYIEFAPVNGGNSDTTWAVVMGGAVNVPPADYLATKAIISSVTIVVKREPFWRGYKPQYVTDVTTITSAATGTTSIGARGKMSISGVLGDLPALVALRIGYASAGSGKWIMRTAYVSQRNNPNNYDQFGDFPAPSIVHPYAGVVADGSTENGTGNAAQSPAVAGTWPVTEKYLYGYGASVRMMARLRCTDGTTQFRVNAYTIVGQWPGITGHIASSVTAVVSSSSYATFDLGPVALNVYNAGLNTRTIDRLGALAGIDCTRTAGSGAINADWVYFMPMHESYVECDNAAGQTVVFVYDNMTPRPRNQNGARYYSNLYGNLGDPDSVALTRGAMRLPPGDGKFYWLAQNGTGGTLTYGFSLRYVPLYAAPKGTGA